MKSKLPTLVGIIVLLIALVIGRYISNYSVVRTHVTTPPLENLYCIRDMEMVLLDPDIEDTTGYDENCDRYVYATSEAELQYWKDKWYGTD